ncbi:MAG: mechanosensitive ion channel [Anaerolineales bacterium]|jgi:small-conductance mechanosensitive channel
MFPPREELAGLWDSFLAFLPRLAAGVLIFLVALILSSWAARVVRRAMERRKRDQELIILLCMLTRWGILALGIVVALEQVTGGKLGGLIAGLGVAGFTLGFALQDVAKNFVAGILLLLQQPFEIGDSIEVAGYGGKVENITLRTTELLTWDGLHVLIPNGDVFVSPIVNYSRADKRRVELRIGVAPETDLEHAARVALQAVSQISGVLEDPKPQVIFDTFAESAIEFTLYYWVDLKATEFPEAKDAGIKAVKLAYEREKIEMPYPTVTVLTAESH